MARSLQRGRYDYSSSPPGDRSRSMYKSGSRSRSPQRYDYSPSPPRNRSCSRYRSFSRSCSPQRSDYSPSPPRNKSRLRYRSRSRSQSPRRYYSDDEDAHNPGNNLYITGLSTRVTERDLEEFCSTEGKVKECHLVVDPRTKESRGFGFVTMETVEDAEYCIKYLNKSVFEGRVVTVEKAKRKRARTPTPGKYLGVRTRGSSSYDYDRPRGYSDGRRSRKDSPYYGGRDYSPQYSPYRGGSRYRGWSPSPRFSPYGSPRRYGTPKRRISYRYRSKSRSASPYDKYSSRSRSRSVSPHEYR